MIAGRMYDTLVWLRSQPEVNAFGEEQPVWVSMGRVHAERVSMRGQRREQTGEHFADYRAEFNVRWAHDFRAHDRVRDGSGHVYTVVAVVPNRARGMRSLVCEGVNG